MMLQDSVSGVRVCAEIASWKDTPPAILDRIWSDLPERRARWHRPAPAGLDPGRDSGVPQNRPFAPAAGRGFTASSGRSGNSASARTSCARSSPKASGLPRNPGRGAFRFDVTDQVLRPRDDHEGRSRDQGGRCPGRPPRACQSGGEPGPDVRSGRTGRHPTARSPRAALRSGPWHLAAGFCVRTSDTELTRELEDRSRPGVGRSPGGARAARIVPSRHPE